jgi:hypothetical protein
MADPPEGNSALCFPTDGRREKESLVAAAYFIRSPLSVRRQDKGNLLVMLP